MSDKTSIEWTRGDDGTPGATWPVTTGCTHISDGCDNCYAATLTAGRLKHQPAYAGLATKEPGQPAKFTGEVRCHPDRLDWPLRWRKPRRIFVCSMSDLFHHGVPDDYIARVFAVMAITPRHTFQVLTKRHGRMRSLLSSESFRDLVNEDVIDRLGAANPPAHLRTLELRETWWPLANVWAGVSVEDQKWADIRIPALLDTPAAVRFLSCEPLLGPVDLRPYLKPWPGWCQRCGAKMLPGSGTWCNSCGTTDADEYDVELFSRLHWVICGGESGSGARPMHPDWARTLRDQCQAAAVPFLFKQWGAWQDGSAAPGQRGTDHIIVIDGRHEPWYDHTRDGGMTAASDLARARLLHEHGTDRAVAISCVGKKAAGRELDGRTWDEMPTVTR